MEVREKLKEVFQRVIWWTNEINQGIQKKAFNLKDIKELADFMKNNLTEKDLFVTLGAGDIYKVYEILRN